MTLGEYHQFMLTHVFRPFQRETVEAVIAGNRIGLLGARQIGKSYALAYCAILLACGWEGVPGHDVKIISETDSKSKRIIDDVHKHLDKMERVVGPIREPNRGGVAEVVLKNGSRISAMVGKPSALQAWTGSVIVDELSLSRFDPEELVAQALIVASSAPHYRTVMATNADREGSFVHRFWHTKRRDGNWKLLEYNIHDVYEDGLPVQIDEIRKSIHPSLWQRFFLNVFASGMETAFDQALVENCVGGDMPLGSMLVAYDPGFSRHAAGIVVCSVSDELHIHEERVLWDHTAEEQIRVVEDLMRRHNATRVIIDVGVGGLVIKQLLQNRIGAGAVVGQSINRNFYEVARRKLERLMMENKLRVNASCNHTIEDLRSFEIDAKGWLKVPERICSGGKVTHCDAGVAVCMATTMLDSPQASWEMKPIDVHHTFGKFI